MECSSITSLVLPVRWTIEKSKARVRVVGVEVGEVEGWGWSMVRRRMEVLVGRERVNAGGEV